MLNEKEFQDTSYNWLITGVAGFVGSHLLEKLLKLNQKVIGIDNFCTGKADNIKHVLNKVSTEQRKNFIFQEGDISSRELCFKCMEGVDYVLHEAAISSIPKSIKEVDTTHEVNINGFFNIIFAAKQSGVKRFVYASSCAVYGNINALPNVETQPVDIMSPYNATKYMNELYATTFSTCYGLETIGLRYFNIYGPRQEANGPYAAVITKWIHALLRREQTYIHDDHQQSRDFCYIDDVVEANILAAITQNKSAINTVYNIASGQEIRLHDIYDIIEQNLKMAPITPISEPSSPGELDHSRADISKATQLLGYTPKVPVREGIARLIKDILASQ